jgi:hypothetical protein
MLFGGIPMPYIKEMLFAYQSVKPEDLIARFTIIYDLTSDIDAQMKIITEDEDKNKTGHLPDLLRGKDPSFCSDFLEYVTGSAFIPYNNAEYEIKVEFNSIESKSFDSLPQAHTCGLA